MTIRVRCRSGHRLSVPDDWAGRLIRCAECKATVRVPQQAAEESPALPDWPDAMPANAHGPRRPGKAARRWLTLVAVARFLLYRANLLPKAEAVRMPADAYHVDDGRLATARWLGVILALAVAFSLGPIFSRGLFALASAPNWARAVVLIALIQAAYVAWMCNVPDWSSVWVVMLVFAAGATLYALATAVALATPPERPIFLGMDDVRRSAGPWCASVCLVMSLATYLSGRLATRWHGAFDRSMAAKRRRKAMSHQP